jgi:hypothetical protein
MKGGELTILMGFETCKRCMKAKLLIGPRPCFRDVIPATESLDGLKSPKLWGWHLRSVGKHEGKSYLPSKLQFLLTSDSALKKLL